MSEFKIGGKCVCIARMNPIYAAIIGARAIPVKDKVYTVTAITHHPVTGAEYLELAEMPKDHSFGSEGFRPLDEDFAERLLAGIAEEINEENLVKV